MFDPATGEQTGTVALASRAEVDEAVATAKRAFPKWAATPPLRRARILNRFLRRLEENVDELAAVITAEHGKVLSDAKGEIQRGLEVVEFAVGAPQLLKGEVTENVGTLLPDDASRPSPRAQRTPRNWREPEPEARAYGRCTIAVEGCAPNHS